ncbi:MAG: hypothetical protein U0840_21740 [Gemmataceae bacterium]
MFIQPIRFTTGAVFSGASSRENHRDRVATFRAALRRTVQLRDAADLLPHLPGVGESLHALMLGNFDFMLVLSAILRQQPEPCRHLRIATLAFSMKNVQELARLFDEGIVERITLLSADYMDRMNNDIFQTALAELRENRGQTVATARTHAKVSLLEYPAAAYVLEGSANLRTNKNLEQVTLINDQGVHQWHAAWIGEKVEEYEQRQAK